MPLVNGDLKKMVYGFHRGFVVGYLKEDHWIQIIPDESVKGVELKRIIISV